MTELIDFYAEWCPPCKITGPIIDELKEEYAGRVDVRKVNVDENQQEAAKFGVMSIPTFVLIKEGQEIGRKIGALSKEEFKTWLEKNL